MGAIENPFIMMISIIVINIITIIINTINKLCTLCIVYCTHTPGDMFNMAGWSRFLLATPRSIRLGSRSFNY